MAGPLERGVGPPSAQGRIVGGRSADASRIDEGDLQTQQRIASVKEKQAMLHEETVKLRTEMVMRKDAREILNSPGFDGIIGAVILVNALMIGVGQTLELNGDDTLVIEIIESLFLCIYIGELFMRLFAHGTSVIRDNWVKLDAILVVLGVVTTWVLQPMLDGDSGLGPLMTLRCLRLLRLAKTFRMLNKVPEIKMLVQGFLSSAWLMLYTFTILFALIYVFSTLAIELITKSSLNMGPDADPAFQAHADMYFSSLSQTMLTLISFACLDQMRTVYKPIVEKDFWLVLYFAPVIFTLGIVMLNLFGAVIFSVTMNLTDQEKMSLKDEEDTEHAARILTLRDAFYKLDADNSGTLSREEIMLIQPQDKDELCKALGCTTPMQVFNSLDVNGDGCIGINEFFDTVWEVSMQKVPVDQKRIEKICVENSFSIREIKEVQTGIVNHVASLERDTAVVREAVTGERLLKGAELPTWAQDLLVKLRQISDETMREVKLASVLRTNTRTASRESNGAKSPSNGLSKKVPATNGIRSMSLERATRSAPKVVSPKASPKSAPRASPKSRNGTSSPPSSRKGSHEEATRSGSNNGRTMSSSSYDQRPV